MSGLRTTVLAAGLLAAITLPAGAQPADPSTPSTAAPAASGASDPLDTAALRYYVSIGDMERVEAEIRRLRSIDPNWQPPADLLGGPAVDENALWSLFGTGDHAAVRARIAELQRQVPGYTPSPELLRELDLAEARARLLAASEARQWQAVIEIGRSQPDLLTCARVDNVWRTAEAFAETGDTAGAASLYGSLVELCPNQAERIATLQKADAYLSAAQMEALYAAAAAKAVGEAERTEIAEIRAQLEAGRGSPPARTAPSATGGAPAPSSPPSSGEARPTRLGGPSASSSGSGGGGGGSVVAAYEGRDYARCLELTRSDRRGLGDTLMRGWCLFELSRPTEAGMMFDIVREQSSDPEQIRDATFGASLALLRRGRISEAVTLARSAELTEQQRQDVYAEALAQGATEAYQREDYFETVRLLEARETIALERRDLSILRGFALYHIRRYAEAQDVFLRLDNALSTPESREGLRVVREALR